MRCAASRPACIVACRRYKIVLSYLHMASSKYIVKSSLRLLWASVCGWSRRGGCAGGGGRAERCAWAGARLIASLWRTISPRGNKRDPAAATHSRRTGCNAPATSHSTFVVGAMLLLVLPAWLVAAQVPARASSSSPIAADAALASLDSGLAAARAYIHLRHLTEGRAPSPTRGVSIQP